MTTLHGKRGIKNTVLIHRGCILFKYYQKEWSRDWRIDFTILDKKYSSKKKKSIMYLIESS